MALTLTLTVPVPVPLTDLLTDGVADDVLDRDTLLVTLDVPDTE